VIKRESGLTSSALSVPIQKATKPIRALALQNRILKEYWMIALKDLRIG
jgi:hypothetical protein